MESLQLILYGPDSIRRYPIHEGDLFTLGRGPGVTLHVDDGDVSRAHATVSLSSGALVVRDLGSTNGTRLNGRQLNPLEDYVVPPFAFLQIGLFLVRPMLLGREAH